MTTAASDSGATETARRLVRTSCPLDCPDGCGLEATVEQGRVTRVEAEPTGNGETGFICSKVRRFPRHMYSDERLLFPAVRCGAKGDGRFERVSWDDALTLATERLRETVDLHGANAILPVSYGGSNGLLSQDSTDATLFRRLGASRLQRSVCAAPSSAAATGLYGKMAGVAIDDYAEAQLIVVWGANPSVSGIHLVPIVLDAQKRGAKLVVVDPRRTPLAAKADLHVAPRPGTDLVLALALHKLLFDDGADHDFLAQHCRGADQLAQRAADWSVERAAELCDVDADAIEQLYRLYRDSSPAVIRCGWGVERNRNGGSAVAAILALPAVAGKFGVRGGGYTLSNGGAFSLHPAINAQSPSSRSVNMNHLGRMLTEPDGPPIRLLFVYNCNALATLPNQELVRCGLEREDLFTIVFDQVMTDTARYADLVLPATTFLEHDELRMGYGRMALQRIHPVVEPVGEARSNLDVFAELTARLGLDHPSDTRDPETLIDRMLAGQDELARALRSNDYASAPAGERPIQFVDVLPRTADGKVDLCPSALDQQAPAGLYGYRPRGGEDRFPLTLISPATSRTVSSTFGQLHRRPAKLEMHPSDAAARGLDGSERQVRVFNELGEVVCGLRLNDGLRRGVVVLAKGLWSHQTISGTTANAVAPDTLADLGGGACFNDARVEVCAVTSPER